MIAQHNKSLFLNDNEQIPKKVAYVGLRADTECACSVHGRVLGVHGASLTLEAVNGQGASMKSA